MIRHSRKYGYKFKNRQVELEGSEGVFSVDDKLMFKGQSHIALKFFIDSCNNKEITKRFIHRIGRIK